MTEVTLSISVIIISEDVLDYLLKDTDSHIESHAYTYVHTHLTGYLKTIIQNKMTH